MPAWVHNRAEHLLAKNPKMSKSQAFAIATKQHKTAASDPEGHIGQLNPVDSVDGEARLKAIRGKPRGEVPVREESVKEAKGVSGAQLQHEAREYHRRAGGKPQRRGGFLSGLFGGQTFTPERGSGLFSNTSSYSHPMRSYPREKWAFVIPAAFVDEVVKVSKYLTDQIDKPKLKTLSAESPNKKFQVKVGMNPYSVQAKGADPQKTLLKNQKVGKPADYKPPKLEPLNIKVGFTRSQYAGSGGGGGMGSIKAESMIPPFVMPRVKTGGPPSEEKDKEKKAATPAGILASAQKVGKPKTTAPPGPSIAQISKPIGFGRPAPGATKTALDKQALLKEVVRLLAKDIPHTPRLMMKARSTAQRAALGSAADTLFQKYISHPLMMGFEKGLKKLPKGKAKELSRKAAKMISDDPVSGLVALAPIPGTSAVFPAKKGIEKLINLLDPV